MKKVVNPFEYVRSEKLFAWGLAMLIIVSIFAWYFDVITTGVMSVAYGDIRLWKCVVQHLLIWIVFSSLLYVGGVLGSSSQVRFVDVFGMNLFALIPTYLACMCCAIPVIRRSVTDLIALSPAEIIRIGPGAIHWSIYVLAAVTLLLLVWFFYWAYKAFAISTNVRNGRGAGIFIVAYVLTELICGYLLRYIA